MSIILLATLHEQHCSRMLKMHVMVIKVWNNATYNVPANQPGVPKGETNVTWCDCTVICSNRSKYTTTKILHHKSNLVKYPVFLGARSIMSVPLINEYSEDAVNEFVYVFERIHITVSDLMYRHCSYCPTSEDNNCFTRFLEWSENILNFKKMAAPTSNSPS